MVEQIEQGDAPQDAAAVAADGAAGESVAAETRAVPPQKRRVVRAAVAAAVVVVLGVGGYVAWTVVQANAREADAAKTAALTKVADEKLAEIWDGLDYRERVWLETESSLALDVLPGLVTGTSTDLDRWDASVLEIEKAMRECPDEATSKAYLKVYTGLRKAISECQGGFAKTKDMSSTLADLDNADLLMIDAHTALNEAVDFCNSKKWSSADKAAADALRDYQKAASLYKAVRKSSGDTGLDDPVALATAYIDIAKMQVKLAQLGRAGSVNNYNATIGKMEKAQIAAGDRIPSYEFEGGMGDAMIVADKLFSDARSVQDLHDEAKAVAQVAIIGRK